MVVTGIVVVARLPTVDLTVINVAVMLPTIVALNVTVVPTPAAATTTVVMFMRYPNLGRRRVLRIDEFKVDFPQVFINPLQAHLDWLPNLEDPVGLATNQGQVLFGIFVVVIVHHADVD